MITTLDLWRKRQEKPKAKYNRPYDPDPAKHLHLHAAGGCARKETLRLLGYPQEPTPAAMQERWDQGKFWEEFIASLWQAEYGDEVRRQVPVETDYGVGFIDVLRTWNTWSSPTAMAHCHQHIVEVKTTTSDRKNWLPSKDYIDQLMLYGHFYPDSDTDVTLELVYFVMDTREILSYPVEMDDHRVGQLIGWLDLTQDAVKRGTPLGVHAGYKPDRFPCGWPNAKVPGACPYFSHCWENGHVRD